MILKWVNLWRWSRRDERDEGLYRHSDCIYATEFTSFFLGSSSPPRAVHSSVSHNFGSSTTQGEFMNAALQKTLRTRICFTGEIRQNNTVSSLSSNNPSGRSELFNFFAAMQEPSRPSSVFAISRSQTPGSPAERPAQTEATSSAGRSIQSPS